MNLIRGMLLILLGFSLQYKSVDPAFIKYYESFNRDANNQVTSRILDRTSMVFSNLEGDTVGRCYYLSYSMEIDEGYWNMISEKRKKNLIYHELGHCVLRRGHTEPSGKIWDSILRSFGIVKSVRRLRDGCPGSIMHPNVIDDYCLSKHEDYYTEELFRRMTRDEYNAIPWDFNNLYGF
jgi:hypothetical protein